MSVLVQESARIGQANREAVRAFLATQGPARAPAVAAAVGVSDVAARGHLRALLEAGEVARDAHLRWALTPRGMAAAGPVAAPGDVARVLGLLPSDPHEAMVRLIRDAVVCRSALAARGDRGWPAFGIFGDPGTFKTSVAAVVGRLFGMADYEHVLVVTDRSPTDLFGGKDARGTWHPSASVGRPVLTLDELDKASGDRLAVALRLLQADSLVAWEGTTFLLPATIIATFNAGKDPREVLPADRVRRMVLLHTSGLASPGECRAAARALLTGEGVPRLDLDRLVPSGERVAADVLAVLDELAGYVTDGARPLLPAEGLALVVPGRVVADGIGESEAAVRVGLDYLVTAATWGASSPVLVARWCRDHDLPMAGEVEGQDPGEVEAIGQDATGQAVELAGFRSVALATIKAEMADLGRADDAEATFLRGALREVARQVERARSVAELRRLDVAYRSLAGRAEHRAEVEAGRKVAHGQAPVVGGRRRQPDRGAMLAELAAVGSRERPVAVLARLGLIEQDPLPTRESGPNGRRWRGTVPAAYGAVVWDGDGWDEPAVRAVLAAAIAAERPALGTGERVTA